MTGRDGSADGCAQRLSSLLDGELGDGDCKSLLQRLRNDDDACRTWAMFSCVGDALRSPDVAAWHSRDFASRVSAQLRREPTVLAPAAIAGAGHPRRWLIPAGGAAVAAAVLIAVGLPSGQGSGPEAVADSVITSPAKVAVVTPRARPPVVVERSPLLERYLAAHRELSAPTLMPNSTPYVRTSGTLQVEEPR